MLRAGLTYTCGNLGVWLIAAADCADNTVAAEPGPVGCAVGAGPWLGRVPRALAWDNESAVGQWRTGRAQLTETMNAHPGHVQDQGRRVPTS